ncbi:hypothetical protein BT96DRAFT_944850 [Gymnopus androsaceus JB14]|uniref:Uncharacterized protein n=1 Tax=Gymnopus androsaceus JB14 TaxID=1447944 RepID=A0A6A4H397_9AGAR|nr:hypothetical protein BT96DRAFT_944850 [Gymnopus androsaceus JB14]
MRLFTIFSSSLPTAFLPLLVYLLVILVFVTALLQHYRRKFLSSIIITAFATVSCPVHCIISILLPLCIESLIIVTITSVSLLLHQVSPNPVHITIVPLRIVVNQLQRIQNIIDC